MEQGKGNLCYRTFTKAIKETYVPIPTGSDPCQLKLDFTKKRARNLTVIEMYTATLDTYSKLTREEYKMTNEKLNEIRNRLHEEEEVFQNDIIVMKQVKDGDDRYAFYMIDKFCQLTATQEGIEAMAKYHHAKISYFPTCDPAIATIRKLLKNHESPLLHEAEEILKNKGRLN